MAASALDSQDSNDDEFYRPSTGGAVHTDEDYTKELAFHLNQLRREETLCDVTIIVDHRRFRAHKVVLCAASNYFSAMFTSGFQETSQSEITIEGNSEAFQRLLDFAYTGELCLTPESITDVISMASYMQFNKAAPLCSQFMKDAYRKKAIRLPDAFNILNLANSHQFPSLKKHARKYLATNFVAFSQTESFLKEASVEYLDSVLSRKDLGLWVTEEQILQALVTWLKKDWKNRQEYAEVLLKQVKLGLIPISNLKNLMDAEIQALPGCKELIDEVEQCLAVKESSNIPMSVQYPALFATRGTVRALISIDPHKCQTCCHEVELGWQVMSQFPNVPFNHQFEGHRLVVAKGQLYLVGGRYMTDQIPRHARQRNLIESCDHFFRYDPDANRWDQLTGMGIERSHCGTVYLEDYIYVIGGFSSILNVSDVQRYNLSTDVWETLAPMPISCSIPVAVVYKNRIVVYGIESMERRRRGHLMWFDFIANRWHVLKSETLLSPPRRASLAPLLVVQGNNCYRISYMNGIARVQQVVINFDEVPMPTASFGDLQDVKDQESIAKRAPRAFCIDKAQYANLNGYAYKLSPELLKEYEEIDNFEHLASVSNEACAIESTIDKYTLIGLYE